MKPGEEGGARRRRRPRSTRRAAQPPSGASRPRRAARGGRREDQGPQLLHRHGDAAAQGVPRQPVPGGGRPGLRRELARGQDDRALPLRQPRAAALPARRLRHHRGHRAHGLAELPAEPAQGLAAGGPDGPARPHRVGVGALHQRVQGGGGPLPGHHQGDPARGPGVRAQAGHLHPQAQGRSTTRPSAAASSSCTSRRSPPPSARSRAASPGPSRGSSCRWRTR